MPANSPIINKKYTIPSNSQWPGAEWQLKTDFKKTILSKNLNHETALIKVFKNTDLETKTD